MKFRDFALHGVPVAGWKPATPERVNLQKQVAIAGTEVICPKCGDVIGRLSVPLYSGMRIPAAAIEFKPHQRKQQNQKAECRKCCAPYMKHQLGGPVGLMTVIHTRAGWI